MSGERGDVNNATIIDWKAKLPTVCEGYTPQDIFNMDETGLFYRDTTKSTFKVKGEECDGGKRSKERLTVALCASMTGEKIPALVIGKCKKPLCFKKITPEALPVIYTSNKKAWMNSALFQWWIEKFNRKMRCHSRKVLLFVDNAPSHPTVELSNVKLAFLPPNTTSKSQPMDQGIIQTMKLKYCKCQLQHVISAMEQDESKCGTQLLKDINVLQAIYWIHSSWKEVESSTIKKCFERCGFQSVEENTSNRDNSDEDDDDDDVPLSIIAKSKELFGLPLHEGL
ncbi:tigger transposable element-derived protein 4-like [Gigantopelta aegis]|uniref:tigger transposable element-derived protein 4-like n=1 Tax=Gigantopelta aegis TaxID=1735272 RepID=UPI001B88BF00|nr:tigger transposable element-derived protein 4-like [Gigantopelta aegis]